jgi:hypothetical protein
MKPLDGASIKKSRKALRPLVSLPKRRQQPAGKGGEIELKFLKAIMIVAVLATALSLGACAQKKETMATGTTSSTHGYSK